MIEVELSYEIYFPTSAWSYHENFNVIFYWIC